MNAQSLHSQEKPCERCHGVFLAKTPRHRFCDECVKAKARARRVEYKRQNRDRLRIWEKNWRQSEQGRIVRRQCEKAYKKRNKEKRAAHLKVKRAVASGRLLKPDRCARCNRIAKIEGHHADYSKPLAVDWLCRACHEDEHYRDSHRRS